MQVENLTNNSIVEKKVLKLLNLVPKSDLMGLEKITILHKPYDKHTLNTYGAYFPQDVNHKKPFIELYLDHILRETPSCISLRIPYASSWLLAQTLFHEIGHHCHHKSHGVKKESHEQYAETYRAKYTTAHFKANFSGSLGKPLLWIYRFCLYLVAIPTFIYLYFHSKIKPDDIDAKQTLASICNSMRLFKMSHRYATEVLEKHPNHPDALVWVGDYHWFQKDMDRAKKYWIKASQSSASCKKARKRLDMLKRKAKSSENTLENDSRVKP